MNRGKVFTELWLPLSMTLIPSSLSAIAFWLWGSSDIIKNLLLSLFTYIVSACVVVVLYFSIKERCKRGTYREYEGVWIQYIPEFERKIAICELKFKDGNFVFLGNNYKNIMLNPVYFESCLFIEDSQRSFYYIISAHVRQNLSEIEGLGKVYDIRKEPNGTYEAVGYFFDVTTADSGAGGKKALQKTYLLKYDDNFYKYHKEKYRSKGFGSLSKPSEQPKRSHQDIYKELGDYVADYCKNRYLNP